MMKYDTYKESGIDWLGKIPEHWRNYRIDWICKLVRGNTGFKKDELLKNGEYVALQYGKTYKVDEVNDSFKYFVNSEFYKRSQIVNSGDTILISTSETIEDLGHSCFYDRDDLGLLGGEQILLKPNSSLVIEKHLYYYSNFFCGELQKYATGLKVFRFNTDDLKQIFITIPLLEEQTQIANYLDAKTQAIDKKATLLEQKIDKYKALRKSLINKTISNGVSPNVKLKESSIDWIKQIPEHWEVKRGKDMFLEKSRKGFPDQPLLAASQKQGVVLKSMLENRSMEAQKTFEKFKLVEKNDFVISLRSFEGGIETAYYRGIISPAYTVFRANCDLSPAYYKHLLKSSLFVWKLQTLITGIRDGQAIRFKEIQNVLFPIPEVKEQIEIADYLDKKTTTIDKIIAKIEKQIEVLVVLRKTLINDVVTGKLKVTGE